MMTAQAQKYTVLCVDDNPHVAEALRVRLDRNGSFEWLGWLPDATTLTDRVQRDSPALVLLDLDMPNRDPFEALAEVTAEHPETKVVVFSGHVRRQFIDRAIEAGAWGYVSKNEGEDVLLNALEKVLGGEFTLSPEVRTALDT